LYLSYAVVIYRWVDLYLSNAVVIYRWVDLYSLNAVVDLGMSKFLFTYCSC